jgi:phosphoribosylformimino-5-aminoimidazole carboxamide ribonucleotide (ProFAR) isomerase
MLDVISKNLPVVWSAVLESAMKCKSMVTYIVTRSRSAINIDYQLGSTAIEMWQADRTKTLPGQTGVTHRGPMEL